MKAIRFSDVILFVILFTFLVIFGLNTKKDSSFLRNPISQFFNIKKKEPLSQEPPEVKIILGGDVMLGRTVMTKSLDLGNPTYPFAKMVDKLREADLVFVNLESPIIKNCPRDYLSMKFCARPEMIEGLALSVSILLI